MCIYYTPDQRIWEKAFFFLFRFSRWRQTSNSKFVSLNNKYERERDSHSWSTMPRGTWVRGSSILKSRLLCGDDHIHRNWRGGVLKTKKTRASAHSIFFSHARAHTLVCLIIITHIHHHTHSSLPLARLGWLGWLQHSVDSFSYHNCLVTLEIIRRPKKEEWAKLQD